MILIIIRDEGPISSETFVGRRIQSGEVQAVALVVLTGRQMAEPQKLSKGGERLQTFFSLGGEDVPFFFSSYPHKPSMHQLCLFSGRGWQKLLHHLHLCLSLLLPGAPESAGPSENGRQGCSWQAACLPVWIQQTAAHGLLPLGQKEASGPSSTFFQIHRASSTPQALQAPQAPASPGR